LVFAGDAAVSALGGVFQERPYSMSGRDFAFKAAAGQTILDGYHGLVTDDLLGREHGGRLELFADAALQHTRATALTD